MCGICGAIHFRGEPAQKDIIQRMVNAIIHRGPDSNGVYVAGAAAVGHCRLAILDMS